jgi:aspartyl/glutamyl-tRNA(Asn/Gln) amidotransferase C subunit
VEVRVERVAASETFALRQRVLRPHQTVQDMALPGDDDPDAGHLVARDTDGAVVATATVRREAPPWDPEHPRAWRLRGMATEEGVRGRGVGALVMAAVLGHVQSHGGGLLWCTARVPALSFYRRAGLAVRGEPWDEPVIGPHVAMWREVSGPPCPTMPGVAERISRQDVAHVARLARLDLTDEELERFTEQLAAVLEHAADVASLDISGVPPTAHPLPLRNVLREDEPRPGVDRQEVLAQAPDVEDGRFKVPRILGEAP